MLTEKDYCDYETSRELKELGFVAGLGEGDCGYCLYDDAWHDQVNRPLLYEVQKWLREEKEFYVFVGREWENTYYYWISKKFGDKTEGITHSFYYPNGEGQFSSYEEALSEGIKEAVKILKEK